MTLIVLIATPVLAATETLTSTVAATTPGNGIFQPFSAFNPDLGTLNSVTLVLNLTTTDTPQVLNLNSGAPAVGYNNVTSSFTTTLTGPDGTTLSYTTSSGPYSGTTPAGSSLTSLATTTSTPAALTATITGTNLSYYMGTGLYSIEISTPSITSGGSPEVGGNGLELFGSNGTFGGTTKVTYAYTPGVTAPEPSTTTLFVAGIVTLAWIQALRYSRACRSI